MHIITLGLASVASAMLMPAAPTNECQDTCAGVFGYLYAFGNSTCATLQTFNRPKCRCSDYRYAQSVVQCINQMVTEVYKVPESVQKSVLDHAYSAFVAACPQYTLSDVASYQANSSSLPFYNKDTRNIAPGNWPVDGPFKLGDQELKQAAKATYYYNDSEARNKRYGAALLAFWAGILLLKSGNLVFERLFPTVSMKISHLRPFRFYRREVVIRNYAFLNNSGVSKVHGLIIAAFSVLVIVFSFCGLPTTFPNHLFLNSRGQMWGMYIGERTGVIPLYMMPLLLLFGGRNNFLQFLTGWPIGPFLLFHKWIARAIMILLMGHAIGFTIYRVNLGTYTLAWSQAYWNWGVVGLVFGFLILVQGMRYLRTKAYDIFVALHIIFIVFFLIGGYIHLQKNSQPIGLYFYYACFAIWGFDRVARILRIFASGVCKIADVKLHDSLLIFVIDQPKHWNILESPGKYLFIHYWKLSLFWQSHPFTLTVNPENHNQLKLFCKVHKGATKRIADMVLKDHSTISDIDKMSEKAGLSRLSQVNAPSLDLPVLLDGPYGHTFDLVEFDKCIFVAGGTGVTAPFSYIQSMLHMYPNGHQRMTLFWAVRNSDACETWFEDELKLLRRFPSRVHVNIFSSATGNRLNIPEVFHNAIGHSSGPVAVMCCGPSSMCLNTRHAVADAMRHTDNNVEYFEELFNW